MGQIFTNYDDAVQWLFLQLPQYQSQGAQAYKPGLERTHELMTYLGHPQQGFNSVHVAGTNGKGSCSHMLASVLQATGLRVGLYTSPHLRDFRERIRINGVQIPESLVLEFINNHAAAFTKMGLSFFEMTVGMAFEYFAKSDIDLAIIETGMGGRLDSTNVLVPVLSVITNIGLDHTQFLGETLEAIAREKAGIIKADVPVVIGQYTPQTLPVFESVAQRQNAPLIKAQEQEYQDYSCDLKGQYQAQNKKTVLSALTVLSTQGYNVQNQHIVAGLSKVQASTGLMGRWQIIGHTPQIVCDTAHNVDGLTSTMKQLCNLGAAQLHLVLGFVNDKALDEIFDCLPKAGIYYFCSADNSRAMSSESLIELGREKGLNGRVYSSVAKALKSAKTNAVPDDVIYVGGSTFVVAEVL